MQQTTLKPTRTPAQKEARKAKDQERAQNAKRLRSVSDEKVAEIERILRDAEAAKSLAASEVNAIAEQRIADSLRTRAVEAFGEQSVADAESIGIELLAPGDDEAQSIENGAELAHVEAPAAEPIAEPTPRMLEEVKRVDALFERVQAVVKAPPVKLEQHVFDNGKGGWLGPCVKNDCGALYRDFTVHVPNKNTPIARATSAVEPPKPPRKRERGSEEQERERRAAEGWAGQYVSFHPTKSPRIVEQLALKVYGLNVWVAAGEDSGKTAHVSRMILEKVRDAIVEALA